MDGPAGLGDMGERLRELSAEDPRAADEIRRARAGFLQAVALRNTRGGPRGGLSRRLVRWWPVLVGASVAVATTTLWLRVRPVGFQIGESHVGRLDDVVEALPGGTTPVTFSEGSTLLLHDSGRIRILSVERAGARILVEDGALEANITPRRSGRTKWDFEVGPYRVTVNGTRFGLVFRAHSQSLRVATQEGRVTVSGGCLAAPRAVSAGENLDASCTPPEPRPSPLDPSNITRPSIATQPTASIAPTSESAGPLSRGPRAAERWRDLLAAGQLRDGLRAAERTNFSRVCQSATSKELLALADAARFFGPSRHAVTALTALRQRFAGSMEASTAAFTLGRIVYERDHAYSQAAIWFETYLLEQPNGPLMGDAFGRLMEARLRAGDNVGAQASAGQYLRRFPEGPYASEARGILSR